MINKWYEYDLEQLKAGIAFDSRQDGHLCLICGQLFAQGEVFPVDDRFLDAARAARQHVQAAHGGMAATLLAVDKKETGLTDNQKELFDLLLHGSGDNEIAGQMGIAPATVRHTRFTLRERARQAKLYLALYELIEEKAIAARASGRTGKPGQEPVAIHTGARMIDERYQVTRQEQEKILKDCFLTLDPPRLKVFSAREKKKIVILRQIASLFDPGRTYSEREVSALLKPVYADFATIRRYLVEYGFIERNADGSVYRLRQDNGNE